MSIFNDRFVLYFIEEFFKDIASVLWNNVLATGKLVDLSDLKLTDVQSKVIIIISQNETILLILWL